MNDLLKHYAQRAQGDLTPPPKNKPQLSVVHAHAEAVKLTENVRKLAGQEPGDGGRKA